MSENCFASLIATGRKFDDGIKKLSDEWRNPHNILLGGYGTNADQAEANLNKLKTEVETLKEKIIEDTKSRENHMTEMDTFLEEAQQTYQDLVQSCSDIEIVLSEYGYIKFENESCDTKSEIGASQNSSLIASDVTDDLLEVEFTPNMTWRHKSKISAS